MTATKSWPKLHLKDGAKVDYQVAAPAEMSTPNLHGAKIAQTECGWKDGDRGGAAQKNQLNQEKENTLDSYRPSHGRTCPGAPAEKT